MGYSTINFIAIPLFAWALFALYHGQVRTYSESLTFVLYFQAAVLLCTAVLFPLPDNAEMFLLIPFTANYLAQGSRRLWGQGGLAGWLRAGVSLILYLLTLFLVVWFLALLLGPPAP